MSNWAGFVGLTALVIVVLVLLTRSTQRLLTADARFRRADATPPAGNAGDDRTAASGATARPVESDAGETTDALPLSSGVVVANVALTQGLLALVVAVGAWYFAIPLDALGLDSVAAAIAPSTIATGLGLGVVLWVLAEAATVAVRAAGLTVDDRLRGLLAPETAGGWLALLGVALPAVAVGEELLFRAAAIGVPAAGLGVSPWLAAAVSSIAFAFCHGIQGKGGVLVAGLLGVALAAAYVHWGSLVVVIVAHYVLDATELLVHEGLALPALTTRRMD